MSNPDVLFIPYNDTLNLLTTEDAMRICEGVYRMQARDSVVWSDPPSFKLDVDAPFHNHWFAKCAHLTEAPTTGVRLYNYYDDGNRNTIGSLERLGYVLLADPMTGHPLAIIDDHWSYAIRAAAAPIIGCKWLGPASPHVLGLIGIGKMGTNALRCLATLYKFEEIRCTSRRPETRETFAKTWSAELGTRVRACDTLEEVASGADIVVGGTTSSDIMCREQWLKPGSLMISLARRELDPDGWSRMDKVVLDSWEFNMRMPVFNGMVEAGKFSKDQMYAELQDIISGAKPGRTRDDERILIHTCGLVSQDLALAHHIYASAVKKGVGIWLPAARPAE
jgi:ornithine cyclodeaminase/alanine dehydrogenase-like protein (mu-crystallin family)